MSENKLYTYLYITNFPKDADLFKKMFEEYVERSFDTESRLVIVIDKPEEKMKYIEPIYQGSCVWPYCHISLFTKGDALVFDWQSLIKQADCYIIGSNEYESSYVAFAFDNGLDIISTHDHTVFKEILIKSKNNKISKKSIPKGLKLWYNRYKNKHGIKKDKLCK